MKGGYIYFLFFFLLCFFLFFFFSLGQLSLLFAAFWSLNLCFACILELESPICVPTCFFLAFGFWFWFHLALVFDVNFTWLLAFVGF